MKITNFVKHRPEDRSDPGFRLPGFQLRWISGKVSENNPGRPWAVIRKSDCPKDLVEHMERYNPSAFSQGDTIRRGDLVLAYATVEAWKMYKEEIRQAAAELEKSVKAPPSVIGKDGVNRARVEINETTDVTQQMIEKFKKQHDE